MARTSAYEGSNLSPNFIPSTSTTLSSWDGNSTTSTGKPSATGGGSTWEQALAQNKPHDVSGRTRTAAYDNAAVRAEVAKLKAGRDTTAKGDYSGEKATIQAQLDQQAAADKAEAEAQAALARRQRKSAYDAATAAWSRYGLDPTEVRRALKGLAEDDYLDSNAMAEAVRGTQSWANRYGAVTTARAKKGLSYLNEGEILSLEDGYRAALSSAGLPKGFYNNYKDFQNWIANDVSVAEIGERANLAEQAVANTDPSYVKAFREMYGIKRSDLAAYFLDRKRGTEVLTQQIQAAEIKSEAIDTGISVNKSYVETLVDKGVSRETARQAFDNTAQTRDDWNRLADLSKQSITDQSLVDNELGLDPVTSKKIKRLASAERSRWGGSTSTGNAFTG